jgi:hypothetical protein
VLVPAPFYEQRVNGQICILDEVTVHIPPQLIPIGLYSAGLWASLRNYFFSTCRCGQPLGQLAHLSGAEGGGAEANRGQGVPEGGGAGASRGQGVSEEE